MLKKYFPELTTFQLNQFRLMEESYIQWNQKINVISRNDMSNLMERHILHSLSIAKIFDLSSLHIIDVGTGGGFPGIPLAVYFPNSHFTLIDSIGKKIHVVKEIINDLKLNNVKAVQVRSEQYRKQFDYILSRAVTNLPDFVKQTSHLIKKGKGIIYLKGGDFQDELDVLIKKVEVYNLNRFFEEEYYETKKIVYIKV